MNHVRKINERSAWMSEKMWLDMKEMRFQFLNLLFHIYKLCDLHPFDMISITSQCFQAFRKDYSWIGNNVTFSSSFTFFSYQKISIMLIRAKKLINMRKILFKKLSFHFNLAVLNQGWIFFNFFMFPNFLFHPTKIFGFPSNILQNIYFPPPSSQ